MVSNYAGTAPGLTVGLYFTGSQQDQAVVRAFTTAITRSMEYASAHPDEARAALSTYTKIDPAVQAALVLPKWPSTVDRASVQRLADLAQKDGLLPRAPDLNVLLP